MEEKDGVQGAFINVHQSKITFEEEALTFLFHRFVQTLKRAAGAFATIAISTSSVPSAAFAAKKVVEVVEVVDNTKKFIGIAAGILAVGAAGTKLLGSSKAVEQNFLEATPYWDQSEVPVNVYKNKAPFTGKVVSTKRIVGPKATGETCHIVIDHKGDFPYWEGQ